MDFDTIIKELTSTFQQQDARGFKTAIDARKHTIGDLNQNRIRHEEEMVKGDKPMSMSVLDRNSL